MTQLKPYPSYRKTDLPWLGPIPAHWEAKQLKRLFFITNGSTPSSGVPEYWDGDIIWVTPEDLGKLENDTLYESGRHITKIGYQNCGTTLAPKGSLILSTRAPIGYLAIAGVEFCTNQGCRSLIFRSENEIRYFYYLMLAARTELQSRGTGTTFAELGKSKLENIQLPIPPFFEQRAIAAYLDHQTAKIAALIAKKERLLDLLAEQRAALISQAVTKGLNLDVKMKDSGVAWLGQVPSHWEVMPLKRAVANRVGAIKTGPFGSQLLSSEMIEGEIKVYNQRSVIDQDFISGENYVTREKYKELGAFTTYPGDVLLTTRGTIGKVAILPKDAEFGILHPCLMRIQPHQKKLLAEYLALLIQDSSLLQTQLVLLSNATTIDVIYSETMRKMIIPLPSLTEQKEIIDYIYKESNKIDILIAKVETAIERLHEYRAALISSAVTGKIQVM